MNSNNILTLLKVAVVLLAVCALSLTYIAYRVATAPTLQDFKNCNGNVACSQSVAARALWVVAPR